jgi:hypothetical protein
MKSWIFLPLGLISAIFCCLWRHQSHSPSGSPSSSCADDQSCSFNGVCSIQPQSTGICQCDPGWTGAYCEALNLAPARNGSGLQDMLIDQNTSTWGGSVLYHQGQYHMWFSEITRNCGIHGWISNSVVSHAVSRGPEDRWKFRKTRTLYPVFSHEPIAAQDPTTGEFGLFVSHYPNGSAADTGICTCVDGSTASTTNPHCKGEHGLGKNKTMYTYFTTASNPEGPWSPLISLEDETPEDQHNTDLNFAPFILSNGSLVAWTRWAIWTARDWKNATTYNEQGQAPDWNDPNGNWEGEDPSMWMDRKGRFHILSHNGKRGKGGTSKDPKGDCGRHLFSTTGAAGTWITAPLPLGGCTFPRVDVPFVDGSKRSFYRRERPHLIFNGDGVPVALSTSVIDSPIGPGMPGFQDPQRDASYTLIQSVNSGASISTIS